MNMHIENLEVIGWKVIWLTHSSDWFVTIKYCTSRTLRFFLCHKCGTSLQTWLTRIWKWSWHFMLLIYISCWSISTFGCVFFQAWWAQHKFIFSLPSLVTLPLFRRLASLWTLSQHQVICIPIILSHIWLLVFDSIRI